MKIYEDKYINMDAIILESDYLRVSLIPEIGFKIGSIYHKEKNKELLSSPRYDEYTIPKHGDNFMKHDESGINDMIPTLENCPYPEGKFKDVFIPDRGEAWSQAWDVKVEGDFVVGQVDLVSLPLRFKRRVSLKENKIRLDYELENLDEDEIMYLWTLQGLNHIDENTELILQDDMVNIINTRSNEDLSRLEDFKKIKSYNDDRIYKYFFWGEFKKGEIGFNYPEERIKYLLKYDIKELPYVGVWIDRRKNRAAVEPSNSFFDSITVAKDNNMIKKIAGKDKDYWSVEIEILDY